MIRMGAIMFCWSVSQPISFPLGSLLFDSGGYICVFSASLLLFVVASLLGLYALWGFKERMEPKDTNIKGYTNRIVYIHSKRFSIFLHFNRFIVSETCDRILQDDIAEA